LRGIASRPALAGRLFIFPDFPYNK